MRNFGIVLCVIIAFGLMGAVSCTDEGSSGGGEVCDNGTDDDGDGFVDCADQDCFAATVCGANNTQVSNVKNS